MSIKEEMSEKIVEAACAEFRSVLEDNLQQILHACSQANIAHAGPNPFNYTVGCSLVLSPRGEDMKLWSKLRWGVVRADQSTGKTVSVQPELFDEEA